MINKTLAPQMFEQKISLYLGMCYQLWRCKETSSDQEANKRPILAKKSYHNRRVIPVKKVEGDPSEVK